MTDRSIKGPAGKGSVTVQSIAAEAAALRAERESIDAEVTRKLWTYIRANNLQDSGQKAVIHADKSLKQVFKKAQVSMFEMTKLVNGHLK